MESNSHQKNEINEINENTEVSVRTQKIFVIIGAIFVAGMIFANFNSRLLYVESQTKEIQFIRETLIRIEGKLDLKQDKYQDYKDTKH